jgi:hypothetical protein
MPFTVTPAKERIAKGWLPPAFAAASSLTPPTPLRRGTLLSGIARSRCGHPLLRDGLEDADAFLTRWTTVPGTDDPSTPPSSTDPTVDED